MGGGNSTHLTIGKYSSIVPFQTTGGREADRASHTSAIVNSHSLVNDSSGYFIEHLLLRALLVKHLSEPAQKGAAA